MTYAKGTNDLDSELEDSRWNRRAWVLQERFFPSRVVHFGAFQVHWECQEKTASQMRSFCEGPPADASKYRPALTMERWWANSLQQYTDLELSVDGRGPSSCHCVCCQGNWPKPATLAMWRAYMPRCFLAPWYGLLQPANAMIQRNILVLPRQSHCYLQVLSLTREVGFQPFYTLAPQRTTIR